MRTLKISCCCSLISCEQITIVVVVIGFKFNYVKNLSLNVQFM